MSSNNFDIQSLQNIDSPNNNNNNIKKINLENISALPNPHSQNNLESNTSLDNNSDLKTQIQDGYFKLKYYLNDNFDSKKVFYCLKRLSFLFSFTKINADIANIDILCNLCIIEDIIDRIQDFEQEKIGKPLQNACLWFIANVMALLSEQQVHEFIEKTPLLDTFFNFLQSKDVNSVEQALWSLANFVSYISIRQLAIEQGIVSQLVDLIQRVTDTQNNCLFTIKINRTLTWLISNLCRKPSPQYDIMVQFLPYLATIIHSSDNQILRDGCLAIGNMVLAEQNSREDDQKQIEEILSFNIGDRAVILTQSSNVDVSMGSLVLLGHLTYGSESQTQYLIEIGILEALKNIIQLEKSFARKKEALFCLSNIIAGTCSQFEEVIQSGILQEVLKIAQTTKQQVILDECLICLMNSTYNMVEHQAQWLIDNKFIFVLAGQYKMKSAAADILAPELQEAILNIMKKVQNVDQKIIKLLNNVGIQIQNVAQAQQTQEIDHQIQNQDEN